MEHTWTSEIVWTPLIMQAISKKHSKSYEWSYTHTEWDHTTTPNHVSDS